MSDKHNKNTKKQTGWNIVSEVELTDLAPQERVDLNVNAFDKLVKQKGVRVKVFRTSYCPRVKSVDGAEHEIDCPLCNGSGFYDVYPIETLAVFQAQELDITHQAEGIIDGNTVAVTFLSGIELQYHTKIELMDFTDIFQERVLRKEGSLIDVLKYTAKRVNFIVDFNGKVYNQDNEFSIDVNGNIRWKSGQAPVDNTPISIHYEAAVQFRAVRAMHVNRFSQMKTKQGSVKHLKFNEQWLMSKEFLVRRKDVNGEDLKQGPYDSHTIVEED